MRRAEESLRSEEAGGAERVVSQRRRGDGTGTPDRE